MRFPGFGIVFICIYSRISNDVWFDNGVLARGLDLASCPRTLDKRAEGGGYAEYGIMLNRDCLARTRIWMLWGRYTEVEPGAISDWSPF